MKDEKVQGMEVNAESGEIIIRNSHGDYAIVPRKDRKKVQDLMDEGCDSCIDNYVMTLPTHKDYAEEGTLIPEGEPVKGESFTPEGTELKAIVIDNKVYIDDGQGGKVQLGGSQGDKILAEYQVSKNKQQEVLEDVTQDVIDKKVGKQETQGSIAMSDEEVEGSQEDLSATIQTQTANASNNEEPVRGFLRDVLDRKQLKDYDKSVKAGLDPYQTLYELGVDFTVNGKSYGKTETDTPQEEITTTDVAKQTVEANKQEDVIESKVGKEQEVVEEPAVLSGAKGEDLSSLSFDDAFRLARKTQNAGGTFVYNGEVKNTNYATEAEEKQSMRPTKMPNISDFSEHAKNINRGIEINEIKQEDSSEGKEVDNKIGTLRREGLKLFETTPEGEREVKYYDKDFVEKTRRYVDKNIDRPTLKKSKFYMPGNDTEFYLDEEGVFYKQRDTGKDKEYIQANDREQMELMNFKMTESIGEKKGTTKVESESGVKDKALASNKTDTEGSISIPDFEARIREGGKKQRQPFSPSELREQTRVKVLENQNKLINSVYSTQEQVRPESEYTDWEVVKKREAEYNKMEQADIIKKYNSGSEEEYLVLDKKAGKVHLYKGDKEVASYNVGTGENIGDEQTKTVQQFKDSKGNIVSANEAMDGTSIKKGYKVKTLWEEGNKQTGAGVYTVSNSYASNPEYFGLPSWNFINERGQEVPMAIHGAPKSRRKAIAGNDPTNIEDTRVSNGCINGLCEDLRDLYNKGFGKGQKLYVLPDNEDESNYEVVDGKLVLRAENTDVNRTLDTLNYKPIKIITEVDNKGNQKTTEEAREFATALENSKQKVMIDMQITGKDYNDIALLALGIMGQETDLGDSVKYNFKERNQGLTSAVKEAQGKTSSNSRGLTQIKYSDQNEGVQKLFKERGITPDNLKDPVKSAEATVLLLSYMYNNELKGTDLLKESGLKWQDALLYLYQGKKMELKNKTATPGQNNYIRSVKEYGKQFSLKERTK